MFKERIKTSAIFLLCFNLIILTCQLWFSGGLWQLSLREMVMNLPLLRSIQGESFSIPRERLSMPRKILINDGSLWIAYYNTDPVFSPLETRTRQIIEGYLRGEASESVKITTSEWQLALDSVSIYVEYPISYTTDMLCAVMGLSAANAPRDASAIHDFIIIPSDSDSGVFIIVRDASDDDVFMYRFEPDSYSLPREDMAIYTENNSGYYEPAFSTGVEPEGAALDPMVLFSDSRPMTSVLAPSNPLESQENRMGVLAGFFNNISTAGSYPDSDGVITYVENYSDVRIYPNGLFEYKAISEDKGLRLTDRYSSYYETINAAISFTEELWSRVNTEPLSVLVTSDLTQTDQRHIRLTMDYFHNGRPVAISLPETGRAQQLNHGIEIDIVDGMIVSYRQFFRSYYSVDQQPLGEDFISALDYFANNFAYRGGTVIKTIEIGYMDRGSSGEINACWLANVEGDDVTYAKEVKADEMDLD